MNVTEDIQTRYAVYGASDYTASQSAASSKQLNFSAGASIQKADTQTISVIPTSFKYADSVGLMGAENYFVKVQLNIVSEVVKSCFEEEFFSCASARSDIVDVPPGYTKAVYDYGSYPTVNTYEQAVVTAASLPIIPGGRGFLSVDIFNHKTGNAYVDKDLDVCLYTSDRQAHGHDKMYVQVHDHFYIGFHARNTKRLAYNVECTIGAELRSYDSIHNKSLIMRKIDSGSY